MTTTSGPGPLTSRSIRRIGLWGAPGSGKTTFLAALNVAVMRASQDMLIFGSDDEATDFLAENTSMLTTQRRFPPATETLRPLSWAMHLPVQRVQKKKFGRSSLETGTMQLNIDLLDAPGRTFQSMRSDSGGTGTDLGFDDDDGEASGSAEEQLIDHLAGCDGIVFLFDPIREKTTGDAYEYFHGTLLRIAQRRLSQGGEVMAKLPQYLAVCITKLDDPDVYRRAKTKGFRSFDENDPHLFPRVNDDSAERFFAELCRGTEVGNADLVSGAIRQYFMPTRVKYFITSAIGFYVGNATRFREQDYQNAVPDNNGVARIRGPIYPINVVEPLLWLGRSLTTPGS